MPDAATTAVTTTAVTGPVNAGHRPGRRAVLAGLLMALTSLAAAVTPARALTYDEVMARHSLRVAVYRDNPPFSWRGADGHMTGIDVDLARDLAGRLGVAVDYMELTPGESADDDLRNAVWKGHYLGGGVADVMMHVPVDAEFARRNDNVAIFGVYYRDGFAVSRDRRQIPDYQDITSLVDRPTGVELATAPDYYLMAAAGGRLRNSVHHFKTLDAAVAALKQQRLAAVVGPVSGLEAALAGDAGAYPTVAIELPPTMLSHWDVGMAVKDNARDLGYALGDALADLLQDGTVARRFAAYGLTLRLPPDAQHE